MQSITGKWRTGVSAALGAAILFLLGVTAVRAEGIVPVEGGWVARTSVDQPVSFEVKEGNVLDAHFGFKWGFCGTYESHLPKWNDFGARRAHATVEGSNPFSRLL